MIKTDHGIRRGVVEKVTAFPLGLYNILERKYVGSRAQQILDKRSDCAWDTFEDFKESSTSICFVEHVIDIDTNTMFLECSCIDGLKGSAPCVHKWKLIQSWAIRPLSQYNSDILEMDDIVIDDNDFDKNEFQPCYL